MFNMLEKLYDKFTITKKNISLGFGAFSIYILAGIFIISALTLGILLTSTTFWFIKRLIVCIVS